MTRKGNRYYMQRQAHIVIRFALGGGVPAVTPEKDSEDNLDRIRSATPTAESWKRIPLVPLGGRF